MGVLHNVRIFLEKPRGTWLEHHKDIGARLQYVIDWADKEGLLEDHCFTFPDGDTIFATGHFPGEENVGSV